MIMTHLYSFLLVALVGCLLGGSEAAHSVELIDHGEDVRLTKILAEVCKREIIIKITTMHQKQIVNFYTIRQLADFLGSVLPYEHEFRECAKDNLEVINRLLDVIGRGNEDVCGEQKLNLIKQFHLDYISKVKKHVRRQKKLGLEIPRILKDFFINYATLVSDRCEQSAMSSLTEAKEMYAKQAGVKNKELSKIVNRNFHHFVSVWNLVDALPWEKNEKLARYLSSESPRVYMAVSNLGNLPTMQGFCKCIRPLYEKTILPLLQLIYMGYYPTSSDFKNALSRDRKAISLFEFLQVCEDLLPIGFLEDEKLKSDELELVPHDGRSKYKEIIISADLLTPVEPKISTSFKGVKDLLELAGSKDLEQLAKTTRSNIKSRGGYMKSSLKMLVKFLKSKTKTQAHAKMIVPAFLGSSTGATDVESIATTDEACEEELIAELETEEPKNEVRVKRSYIVVDIIKTSGQWIVSFLMYIIYLVYYAFLEFPRHFFAGKVRVAI